MSVIIFILKIIGIILLVLLGILLVLLGLVLFVPVRYRIGGSVEDEFEVRGHVSWMLHLLGFYFSYQEGEFKKQFKICGIRVGKRKKNKKTKKEDVLYEAEDAPVTEDVLITEDESVTEGEKEDRDTAALPLSKEPVPEKKSRHQKKQGILGRIRAAIRRAHDTLANIKDKIYDIKNFIVDETNKKLFQILQKEIRYLLKHFKFRTINTDLRFSLGDPANTGQALGILSMMPWLYRYQFHISPDFEAKELYVRGVFDVRGRIRLIHVVVSAVRILLQKECRTAIKKFISK